MWEIEKTMSLDTVLKIGKAFKNTNNNFQHLSYLYNPKGAYKQAFMIRLPLKDDFRFDWNSLSILSDENLYNKLYELRFKTSGSDSTIKYLYGDILYEQITGLDKKGKIKPTEERGRIRLQKDTFKAAKKDVNEIVEKQKEGEIEDFVELNELQIFEDLDIAKKNDNKKIKEDLIAFLKRTIKKYEPKQIVKIPAKYKKLETLIYSCLNTTFDKINETSLLRFRKSFNDNRDKIYTLLRYSAAFEEYFSNQNSFDFDAYELFENKSKLIELAANYVLNTAKEVDLEKILGKDYKERQITFDEKNKLSKFINHAIFIHFEYPDGNMWYDYDNTWHLILEKLMGSTFSQQEGKFVLDKSIYRTLSSGDKKNDIQFPDFRSDKKYKSQYFDNSQIEDLLYGLKAYHSKAQQLQGTDIFLTLLPKGNNLDAEDYDDFINRRLKSAQLDEINQDAVNEEEPLFVSFFKEKEEKITSFDLLLVNTNGNTNKDLIEISNVRKSTLDFIRDRIDQKAVNVLERKQQYIPKAFKPKIEYAFQNILGSPQADKNGKISFKANSRYEAHLLKVLPQIYCMNYYQDRMLLPFFIEKVEFATRSGDKSEPFFTYHNLKYDIEFLLTIHMGVKTNCTNT